MKKRTGKPDMPKTIYVQRQNEEEDGGYLSASETPFGAAEQDETVEVYEYTRGRKVKIVNRTTVE